MALCRVIFRLYEELNRHVPPHCRKSDLEREVLNGVQVGRAIELLGVPLGEVDLILVNGESEGFDRRLSAGDRVSVYPEFERLDIGGVTRLNGRPLRRPRFIASERELESLAGRLRRSGHDVLFDPSLSDDAVVTAARRERRTLLSTRPHLLGPDRAERGILLKLGRSSEDLAEDVFRMLDLSTSSDRSGS